MKKITLLFVLVCSLTLSAQENPNLGNTPEIVGGGTVQPHDYPWMTSLVTTNTSSPQGCGATLIRPQWVLTAGHCSGNDPSSGVFPIDKVIINSVIVDLNNLASFSELIQVDTVILHVDYQNPFTGGDGSGPDIALVHLSVPAITAPVNLADFSDSLNYAGNMPAQVLGWGKTVTGGNSVDSLRHANCIFVAADTCAELYSNTQQNFHNLNIGGNICAGFFSGTDSAGAAQGDSGGPLFYTDTNGDHVQVGIVSGGDTDVTTEDFPGVFTLVPKYMEWIETTINNYNTSFAGLSDTKSENLIKAYFKGDRIQVEGLNANNEYFIEVFDISGRLMSQENYVFGVTNYNIELLNSSISGLYLVKILNQATGSFVSKKIMISVSK